MNFMLNCMKMAVVRKGAELYIVFAKKKKKLLIFNNINNSAPVYQNTKLIPQLICINIYVWGKF